MIEIIRRKTENNEVYRVPSGKAQISYNSDGHLVVRVQGFAGDDNEDALVVFDREASDAIIRFVQEQLARRGMEIPF